LLALVPFALAFGTMAAGSGLSTLEALAMSVFVFAGAAQLAMVPLISAGASVAVIVLTVLVINLRMTLYSASLAPHFRRLPAGWKGLLSYLLTDQAYAATITRFDEGRQRAGQALVLPRRGARGVGHLAAGRDARRLPRFAGRRRAGPWTSCCP
jgi:predicted branched-subunit amino acid permease